MGLFVLIYIKIKEGNIMIKNKICKVLACLVVALMIFTTVGQTAVYAAKKTESKTFVLSNKRKVKNKCENIGREETMTKNINVLKINDYIDFMVY